jgi:peptidoglycan/xylan/chitin deacetylase (PgdA/CDA1 family)
MMKALALNDEIPMPERSPRPSSALGTPRVAADTTTTMSRWRSRAKRALVSRMLPQKILVTRGRPRGRFVALTFDDGPDEMTPRYLDVCDALRIRATFFVCGENVEHAPHMALEYVRRGHEVAGHGYTHDQFPKLGAAQLIDEIARTDDLLPAGLAPRPLVRPPGGRLTLGTFLRIAAAGYTTVLWSLDSDDCRTNDPRRVRARVAPEMVGPGEIILMHENQTWTLEALPGIVEDLREAGFDFVTVSELLGY